MWKIYELKSVTRNLKRYPISVQKKYKIWIEITKNGGPHNLRNFPGFRDELLKGKLSDSRSSRLNRQYRVIYNENKYKKEVYVIKVTPHKYK